MADDWLYHRRPTAAEIGDAWREDAEFRALQLGTWLNTPDGQMIAAAVEAVSPPFYAEDERLLVAALRHAAARQHEEGVQTAGRNALIALGVAGMAALLIGLFGSGPGGGG
jgi:multisubunit Na+/H+ antiporter MnhB subunit